MEAKRFFWFFWKFSVVLKRFQHGSKKFQLYVCMCLLTFCATSLYLLMLWNCSELPDRAMSFRLIQKQLWNSIRNDSEEIGCVFPVVDPYSEEATKFLRNVSKITCEGEDWVDCYLSECRVKSEILKRFKNVVCNYKDIVYVNDRNYYIGEVTKVIGEGKYYLNGSDHVKVSCTGIDKTGLGLMASRWFGYKAGLRPITRVSSSGKEDSIDVLVLALDSTSRYAFIRSMPKSYHVLTKELQGTVLKGFQIVGDGTSTTLFPLLSGKTDLEHPDSTKKFSNGQLLDPKSFIFHNVQTEGYHTAYFEDSPWIGSFQYKYNGFSAAPADHYLYPFFQEVFGLGLKRLSSSKYCLGAMPQYLFMLNITKQFMEIQGKRFCFTFIADITHDDFSMITVSDENFAQFFREFKKSGKLKDTLLIVMGDHGSRYGPIRETYQGSIEERLPLMIIVLPEKLMQERPEALSILKGNDNTLITPFDVHTTLLDVTGLKNLANGFKVPGSELPRGISLLERIPKSRNCGQAAILPHWCSCNKWSNVSVSERMYSTAATFLAQFINNITLEQRELCVERTLTSIEWVMRHVATFMSSSHNMKPYVEVYQAKIVMAPGRAVYEGSMKYYAKENRFVISEAEISRITAYRNEPHCVSESHPHLNKYCYCKDKEVKKSEEGDTSIF